MTQPKSIQSSSLKILFITSNSLGDAVLSTGLLGWLVDKYPKATITVACGPLPAPLFRSVPQVRKVIELTKRPRAGHWRRLWWQTAGTRWDIVVDLRQSLVSRLILARKRYIWKRHPVRVHKVTELAAVLRVLPLPAPRLWQTETDAAEAAKLVPPGGLVLALAPGANSVGKTWPAQRYRDLAAELTAPHGLLPHARVLLVGGTRDAQAAALVASGLPKERVIDLTDRAGIALTAACLARADFFIGNDSGVTHVAAASGVPTLALFGPGIAWKYRPWGPKAAYLSKADDPTRDFDLCRNGDDKAALALMERITVDDAVDAAVGLWQKIRHEP
jgi:lipopolysaccharide export system permease protein